jgi:hypothetical protein
LYRYDSESVSENQCCGSELIFFGFGSTKYFFRIRILRLIFWPGIFLNGASHCFYSICVWNLYYREKSLPIENHIFFSFKWWIWDFHKIFKFILQQGLDPYSNPNLFRIRIRPKFTESFGFGSTTLVKTVPVQYYLRVSERLSDSDLQIFISNLDSDLQIFISDSYQQIFISNSDSNHRQTYYRYLL